MSSRQPLRIGMFLPDLNIGGVERVMLRLAAGFTERGHSVDVVTASNGETTAQLPVPDGVHLVELGRRRTVTALPGLAHYLRGVRPAALLAAKDHANVVAVLAAETLRPRTPVVATVHSRPSDALRTPERWTGVLVRNALPWAYGRAAAAVAVSEGVAADLRSLRPHRPLDVIVVQNPVIDGSLRNAAAALPDHPWFTPPLSIPVVVWCGRLTPEKDPRLALEAFARVRASRPAHLAFVGDGPMRDELLLRAEELRLTDDVMVTGYVDQPERYLNHAQLVVLSSRREGLPTVLIEALALGTPVVSTDCESGPREILADGKFGRLVPVGRADALADALLLTLDQPFPSPPEHALDSYTVDVATSRYLDVLQSIGAE